MIKDSRIIAENAQRIPQTLKRFRAPGIIQKIRRPYFPVEYEGVRCFSIPLTKGLSAIVDECDIDLVGRFNWCASKCCHNFYAQRKSVLDGTVYLHRLLLGFPRYVDHKNLNTLDNRRCNIRAATALQNSANKPPRGKTGFKGVKWNGCSFVAEIRTGDKLTRLGNFRTAEEAARKYDMAAIELYGEFAHLNIPLEAA